MKAIVSRKNIRITCGILFDLIGPAEYIFNFIGDKLPQNSNNFD